MQRRAESQNQFYIQFQRRETYLLQLVLDSAQWPIAQGKTTRPGLAGASRHQSEGLLQV
jgi:hypothetical protein